MAVAAAAGRAETVRETVRETGWPLCPPAARIHTDNALPVDSLVRRRPLRCAVLRMGSSANNKPGALAPLPAAAAAAAAAAAPARASGVASSALFHPPSTHLDCRRWREESGRRGAGHRRDKRDERRRRENQTGESSTAVHMAVHTAVQPNEGAWRSQMAIRSL